MRGLGRKVFTVYADLAEPTAAGGVVDAVADEFGRLDILVSNAGITHWGSVAQTSVEGAPGSTATGPCATLTEGQKAEAGASFGLGRIGEPADTAAVVAFLASERMTRPAADRNVLGEFPGLSQGVSGCRKRPHGRPGRALQYAS